MSKKALASDSSSEDENLAKFKEVAVSFETIKESNDNQRATNSSNKKFSKRCVGQVDENDEDDANNILKVTPEFQHFVATKLSQKLDKYVKHPIFRLNTIESLTIYYVFFKHDWTCWVSCINKKR